jgi:hypothetical protein
MDMNHKEKLNQPYYTKPVNKTQSNLPDKTENLDNNGLYQSSEAFPPRGSFINIPEDVLSGTNGNLLDSIVEDKDETIGSDLYKETKNNK